MTAGIFGASSSGLYRIFARKVYSGNSSTQSIVTNVDNDLVWIKSASSVSHYWFDSVRGVSASLSSNSTSASTTTSGVTAFNVDGFTLGAFSGTNDSGQSFNSFVWKEAQSYFDIVTYTGNGSARTISHNLGATPALIIIKSSSLDPSSWPVYHASNTANPETDYLLLNSQSNTADDNTYWNDTQPTSSVFSVGTNDNVNKSGETYVAYLFAASSGNSYFGTYAGTGSSQTITLGYQPTIVIVKASTGGGEPWILLQGNGKYLEVNSAIAEASSATFGAPTSNGFSVVTSTTTNGVGKTYLYMAWR